MANEYRIRWRWLKAMYVYTAVVAGGIGLGMVLVPGRVQSMFGMSASDPLVIGLNGSLLLSFAFAAILGFRAPLKYCPVLLMEVAYKAVWLLGVVVPLASRGEFPRSGMVQIVIFVTFIIGDLVAIPFRYVFSGDIQMPGSSKERTP